MRFTKLKGQSVLFVVILAAFSLPMIGGAASSEEPKDEAPNDGVQLSKEKKEFIEKRSKLTTLENRIEEADLQFSEMVRKKAEAKTSQDKQAIIKEMIALNEQRSKDVDNYNKIKADLTYRYPNEGEDLNRRYKTQNKRSLEDVEGVAGLDEMLSRTKKLIDRKFAPLVPPEERAQAQARSKASPAEEKPKRLRLEK